MKTLNSLAVIALAAIGLASQAQAVLINITNDLGNPAAFVSDYDKGLLGGLGNAEVAGWLADEINDYNSFLNPGTDLLLPGGSDFGIETSGIAAVNLTGYSYAVVHYGTGPGGLGQGGGIQAWYLNGTAGLFTFPTPGTGPNGNGGISFVRLYGPTSSAAASVPDGGMTAALLGLALVALGLVRHYTSRFDDLAPERNR